MNIQYNCINCRLKIWYAAWLFSIMERRKFVSESMDKRENSLNVSCQNMFLYRDHEALVETAQIIECWVKDIGVAAIFWSQLG